MTGWSRSPESLVTMPESANLRHPAPGGHDDRNRWSRSSEYAESKANLKGPAAAAFANLLDQVMWHRFISPCQWAGIAILLVCSAIAIWKCLDRTDLDDEKANLLSAVSKVVSRLIGH